MRYKSFILALREFDNRCKSQLICAAETVAYLSAYFFHLRARLDNKKYPVLIVDRGSGSILSLNLPAFELFAINAVGLTLLNFMVDQEAYQSIIQQLQQTGETRCKILLQNADGVLMNCTIKATVAAHYSEWVIFRFNVNR